MYEINKYIMVNTKESFTKEEIELVNWLKNNINLEDNEIKVLAGEIPTYWFLALTGYKNHPLNLYDRTTILKWIENSKSNYQIILKRSFEEYKINTKRINETVIFENEAGFIIENKHH